MSQGSCQAELLSGDIGAVSDELQEFLEDVGGYTAGELGEEGEEEEGSVGVLDGCLQVPLASTGAAAAAAAAGGG